MVCSFQYLHNSIIRFSITLYAHVYKFLILTKIKPGRIGTNPGTPINLCCNLFLQSNINLNRDINVQLKMQHKIWMSFYVIHVKALICCILLQANLVHQIYSLVLSPHFYYFSRTSNTINQIQKYMFVGQSCSCSYAIISLPAHFKCVFIKTIFLNAFKEKY